MNIMKNFLFNEHLLYIISLKETYILG